MANMHDTPPAHTRVEVLGNIGTNWFASVMGPGIVATAGAALPVQVVGLLVTARTARGSLLGNLLEVAPSTAPIKAHRDSARA